MIAIAVLPTVSACADGGPGFFAKAMLESECAEVVYVAASSGTTSTLVGEPDLSRQAVEPHGSLELASSLRAPVGDFISIFVVSAPKAPTDERIVVEAADLEHFVDADGYDVYVIPISDDMCPN